jgi:hypothetical protein
LREVGVSTKLFVLVVLAMALAGAAMFIPPASSQLPPPRGQSTPETEMLERAAREANKKRQQEIQSDTDRLFQLANELKEAVGKSNEHVLSLDVIRKADEVEKLAHRVKEKMKESIGPPTHEEPPRIPVPRGQ